ncbi:hypothetical protein MHZ90_19580 [Pantoea sp. ACRSH]|uniref:hypothetical protein n=1 Tax=unclassified Pantoea TaxID=2630326 RepID=UPI001EF459D6|nr:MULTISPECIES: hypothetical protein [unclassified Pantoea]MCG7368304.1 hypothetical protein [Pantoea sp. ACRSH]MCG7398663.1 hypothetical protein [Pantoea sp. ACRSC]
MKKPFVNNKGKGIFSRQDWINESLSLYISAKILRKQSIINSGTSLKVECADINAYHPSILITASNKSSRLLIGYSLELLLKSAVLLMNYGAKKQTIEGKFRKYGHDLILMAQDLELPISKRDSTLLSYCSEDIRSYARYPVSVYEDDHYNNEFKKRHSNLADDDLFSEIVHLYDRLKSIIVNLDNSVEDCAEYTELIFKDLTLFMRVGGGIKARAIVSYIGNYPTEKRTKAHLKVILNNFPNGLARLYTTYWDEYDFFEDNGKVLLPLRDK